MNITALILATLMACDDKAEETKETGETGYDTCYGEPMIPSDFDLTAEVDEASLEGLLASLGLSSAEELACEDLCEHVVNDQMFSSLDSIDTCTHTISSAGDTATVSCSGLHTYYCEGRRPLGHVEAVSRSGDALGGFLARCAHLEAASVVAFEQLAAQLEDLGAPPALIGRCLRAASEEREHTQAMSALARRHGGVVPPVRRTSAAEDLEAIAAHNAVEGCVFETWAALVACWRGRRAPDPAIRAAYARIARDELRHAELAWDLHAWLLRQLDAPARARVEAAQAQAVSGLPALAARQARHAPGAVGMPSGAQAAAMAERLGQGLTLAA